jgi:hypothetical protein
VKPRPGASYVRALLRYYPKSGNLRWRVNRSSSARAGNIAGYRDGSDGRKRVCIDNRNYLASRLAWLLMTSEWPPKGMQIDHRDGNPSNNAWDNLRLATHAQNCWNRGKLPNSTTGYKGVSFHKRCRRYIAKIKLNGKDVHLGYFSQPVLAAIAYRRAAQQLHGEFARFR